MQDNPNLARNSFFHYIDTKEENTLNINYNFFHINIIFIDNIEGCFKSDKYLLA